MNVTHPAPLPDRYQRLVTQMHMRYGAERANEIMNEMADVYETVALIAHQSNAPVDMIRQEIVFMYNSMQAIAERGNGISEVQTGFEGTIQNVSDPISLTSQEPTRRKARRKGRFYMKFTRSNPLPS